MTNKFSEWQEKLPSEVAESNPILCDITNIRKYLNHLAGEIISLDELTPDLPWDKVWFEYTDKGNTIGVFAMPSEEKIFYFVFTDCISEHIGDHIFLGFQELLKTNTGWEKGDLGISNDLLYLPKETQEYLANTFIQDGVLVSMYACTFSHCKNVDYYEKSHPEKLQKANIKRGKKPQETYKVLDIGGLQKQAKSESTSERGELKTALHICRGHFKTYTEENPLFGKHTGTYWWPMHKRGSEDNGKVNKDYKVHPS